MEFTTWVEKNKDKIYRFWVYKRMFAPLEQDSKWMDQSEFEDSECAYCKITNAIDLGNGDFLLELLKVWDDGEDGPAEYYRLSEIRLAYWLTDSV